MDSCLTTNLYVGDFFLNERQIFLNTTQRFGWHLLRKIKIDENKIYYEIYNCLYVMKVGRSMNQFYDRHNYINLDP